MLNCERQAKLKGMKKHVVADVCVVKVEGRGSFAENVARIRNTMAGEGWTFLELVYPMNDAPTMFFKLL